MVEMSECVGFNVPLDTQGHFGDDFYRPGDQTNSVKALKEISWNQLVVKIRLESHQNHSTMLQ